jgi:plastocyanin
VLKSATNSEGGPGVRASLFGLALLAGASLFVLPFAAANATPPDDPALVRAASESAAAPISAEINGPSTIIEMSDDSPMYRPNSVVIRAGQTVEWHNSGEVSHSVVDDPSKADKPEDVALPAGAEVFESGNVMPGGKFRHTFRMPGTYRYFCISHEVDEMIGEIIVKPPAPAEAARTASQLHAQPWPVTITQTSNGK